MSLSLPSNGKLITLEAIHLVWYRMLIAFITLVIFLAFKNQLFSIKRNDFLGILGVGVLVTFHWLCFFHSIKEKLLNEIIVNYGSDSI